MEPSSLWIDFFIFTTARSIEVISTGCASDAEVHAKEAPIVGEFHGTREGVERVVGVGVDTMLFQLFHQ